MALNVFLFFPETESQILNDDLKQIIKDFFNISNIIKSQNSINLFYDSNNISTFKELNELTEIYLDNDINKLRLKLSRIGAKDILTNKVIDNTCHYFQWNFNKSQIEYCFDIIKDITERKIQFELEQYILINFNDSIEYCRERILVFKDAKHISNFPSNFIHIDFVSDFLEFEIWLKTNHIVGFSLLDKNKFKRTSLVQQGKPVFESLETGAYWYMDNFHKDEYEVFDSNRTHIGVANLNGIIDSNKAIAGRNF